MIEVCAAVIKINSKFLITTRPEGTHLCGQWEFPGGKVEDGELPESALVRELKEELGIDITESCLAPLTFASHVYDDFHLLMPLYICRVWKGDVTPLEGQQLKWLRPIDMGSVQMPPADVPLVALLRDWL